MEDQEKARIEALLPDDAELTRLWREHQEFENRISAMEGQPYLSWDEWSDIHRLKKLKLAGKDRIVQILSRSPAP
jgi:uncharacterized protein